MLNESVKLIECYRNTIQGEGIDTGKRVSLFRFKYCDRNCSYCDTRVKMRIQQEAEYSLKDLQEILDTEKTSPLITGGETTILNHYKDTLKIINKLNYRGPANIETNGYDLLSLMQEIDPSKLVNICYSAKIFNEKDLNSEILKSKHLQKYPNVYYKVVYENNELINSYLEALQLLDVNHRVFLMPEGTTKEALIKNSGAVFDACEKYKFNFSSRDHIIYEFI